MEKTELKACAVLFRINHVAATLTRAAERALQEQTDITMSQLMILRALKKASDCPQRAVAQALDLTQAAISRQVENLQEKGLVERVANEHSRREHVLSLTDDGVAAYRRGVEIVERSTEDILAGLPAGRRHELEAALGDIQHHAYASGRSGYCMTHQKGEQHDG